MEPEDVAITKSLRIAILGVTCNFKKVNIKFVFVLCFNIGLVTPDRQVNKRNRVRGDDYVQ